MTKNSQEINFKALFEAAPGLYLILTPDFKIVAATNSYLHATMVKREEILGRDIFDVFPDNPNDPDANGVKNLRASLMRVLTEKQSDTMAIQKYDVRRPQTEGGGFEERYWSPINCPVLDANNEIQYIIHRVEDVTQFVKLKQQESVQRERATELQKHAQKMEIEIFERAQEIQDTNKKLLVSNKELLETNQELEAFSYSVSHDLRAPLHIMAGFLQILTEDYAKQLPIEPRKLLERINKNILIMEKIIQDLLIFSRMSKSALTKEKVNLVPIAKEIMDELLEYEGDRKIDFTIQSLPECYVDVPLIKHMLCNLFSNAIKFTRTRSEAIIEFGYQKYGTDIIYFIKDNGVGFDMEYAMHLFGTFQRLHSSNEYEGTGLGLAIAQRVIQRHGGKIWAESEVDKGTTFYFTLPEGY